jgi:hypothetical protein
MGIFTELYAEREPVFIEGGGHYKLKVLAGPNYQNYLKSLCGGYSIKGSKQEVVAILHYENCNQSDKNTIRVVVNGGTVGYLSPKHARLYRKRIEKTRQDGIVISCNARILGGKKVWFFQKPDFSIWIDLPIKKL